MNASEPTTAYLFVHFTGLEQSETDEQLYFALSRDGRHWRDLREAGFPVLTWKGGEGGVRDPHIVRDPRGGFHIVATDLSIYHRGGWGPHDGATEKRLHGFGLVERVAPRAFSQQDTFRLRVGKYDVDIGLLPPTRIGTPPLPKRVARNGNRLLSAFIRISHCMQIDSNCRPT